MSIYDQDLHALSEAVIRLLDKPKKRVRVPTPAVVLPQTGGGIPDVVLAAADTKFTQDADLLSGSFASDDAMIAAALDRMSSQGSAWIHFLEGNYTISSDTFLDEHGLVYVKITGAGQGLTTIKIADGASIISPFWIGGPSETADTVQRLTIEDLTIDGNKAGLTTVSRGLISGSAGSADPVYLTRVELMNSPAVGLGGEDASSRTGNHWFLTDCYIHNNDGNGLSLSESSSTIKGCRIESNGDNGIFALFGGVHKISSTVIANNTGDGIDGVSLSGLAVWIVVGSFIDGNGGSGIAGGGLADPSIIVGNVITDNVGLSITVSTGSITGPNIFSGNGTNEPSPTDGTDHGDLSGLADDDHTQYLLADGSRTAALLNITAQVAAQYFDAAGLTGATSDSRYVGATASGAPVSGTFAIGDFIVDRSGSVWVCTTAGTPGTWTEVGAAAATDTDAIHDNVAGEINLVATKAAPVDADLLLIEDSADSFNKKKVTVGTLPGGSGGAFVLEPGMKPPDSPHADDDEFEDANGTDPTTTGWSWGNQQSCTAAVNSGLLGIDATTSTVRGIHGLFQAVPATGDVSITTRATGTMREDFHAAAVVFLWGTLATPTDIEVVRLVHLGATSGHVDAYWSQYSAYATFSANRGNTHSIGQAPSYLRLEWDDTASTVQGLWSPRATASALSYTTLGTAVSKASRPDFMGVAVIDESTGSNLPISLFDFFRVNWTPDFDPTS